MAIQLQRYLFTVEEYHRMGEAGERKKGFRTGAGEAGGKQAEYIEWRYGKLSLSWVTR